MIKIKNRLVSSIESFLELESAGGVVLILTTILALIVANSSLTPYYNQLLELKVSVILGSFSIDKPLLLWVNDGLMAVFFFLIGLELKREFLEGELSDRSNILLPLLGAAGGFVVPALSYSFVNWGDPIAMKGWAIPVATDIAFALALLSAFGNRVPLPLKVFLTTLAIFDDLAAIVVIALFYTSNISLFALLWGAAILLFACLANLFGIKRTSVYLFLGLLLWVAVLKSGVHATLAGVVIAFCVPMKGHGDSSPLISLEHNLHGLVAYVVLPVFAFCNAGISFTGMSLNDFLHPIPLGIMLGLFVGKPLGILLALLCGIKLRIASLPTGCSWKHIIGVSFISGIGFTMSLFIASLAFEHTSNMDSFIGDRLGIVVGSLVSAILGYLVLASSKPSSSS